MEKIDELTKDSKNKLVNILAEELSQEYKGQKKITRPEMNVFFFKKNIKPTTIMKDAIYHKANTLLKN